MEEIRVVRKKGFTVISNTALFDKRLSWKALGILTFIIGLPDDWDYSIKGLAAIKKDKVESTRKGIMELEQYGYVKRFQPKGERGRFTAPVYYVSDEPDFKIEDIEKNEFNEKLDEIKNELKRESMESNLTDLPSSENRITVKPESDDLTDLPSSGNRITVKSKSADLTDLPSSENRITVKPESDDLTDLPSSGNPITENPITENPPQNIKELNNNFNSINQSLLSQYNNYDMRTRTREDEKTDGLMDGKITEAKKREIYARILRENIDFDYLEILYPHEKDEIHEIAELMLDIICADGGSYRINGAVVRDDIVKSRFFKLNTEHLEYVIEAFKGVIEKINNPRSYLIAMLYNAPVSSAHALKNQVNNDMYG